MLPAGGGEEDNKLDKPASQISIQIAALFYEVVFFWIYAIYDSETINID